MIRLIRSLIEDPSFHFLLTGLPSMIATVFIALSGHYAFSYTDSRHRKLVAVGALLVAISFVGGILINYVLNSSIDMDNYLVYVKANHLLYGLGLLLFSLGIFRLLQERTSQSQANQHTKGPFM